ncbi:hypothetical protein BDY24DRAFT_443076 [Mrakia frigida]|uniref:BTB/POZ domain-containing protein n=1 Tax=Mrakia frigida TaxID=29902 RepID=UPI003FCC2531
MSAASPSDPTLKRDRSPSLDASNEELTAVHPSTSSKKLKSSSPVPPPLRTRSSRYHFSDGNLVLQVEQTDFKVHRSVLRRRSNVFADMFKVGGNQKGSLEVGAEGFGRRRERLRGAREAWKEEEMLDGQAASGFSSGLGDFAFRAVNGVSFALQYNTLDDLYGLLSLTDKYYEFVSLLSDAKDLLVKTVDDLLGPSFDRTDLDDPDLLNDLDPRTLADILDLGTRFDEQSETGWKARGLAKDHLVKLFTVLQKGLQPQQDLFDEFKPWEPRLHHSTCSGQNCRTAIKRRWTTHWSLKLQRNHLDFRALVLLMIKDQSWDGHKNCEWQIYDESLSPFAPPLRLST